MLLAPLAFLLTFPLSLLAPAILGGGVYVLWGWYSGALVGAAYLVGGLALTVWALTGRWIVLLLLGRNETDAPTRIRSGEVIELKRPDGTRLRVERYGRPDGPTVLLTHGWGTDSTEWQYARQALGSRFRVLVWDLRGLGQSSAPPTNDYRLESMATDLEAVLGLAAGGEPVVLAGHSIGGMTILSFCRHFPEHLAPRGRVAGLALVNTTYTTPLATTTASGFFSAIRRPVLEPLLYLTIWLWPLMWLGSWMSYLNGTAHLVSWLTGFTGRAPRGQLDFTTWLGVKASPAVLARGVLATFLYDEATTLAAVGVPTLVITGDGDRVLVPQASAHMAETLPHAELLALQDARHQALLQRHLTFDEELTEFADQCLAAAAARAT
ncbi:MAG TPA: alpha/beta hydrolase [Chloroflexota bacterium]|nr:alpha/beta hydrolase [Chloroflexota bacterium]